MSETVAVAATAPATADDGTTGGSVFIHHVRVFDGERSIGIRDVIVRGGRIAKIGRHLAAPGTMATLEGRGRTLLPGLIDAHVHSIPGGPADALRFGVTTEYDMYGFPDPATVKARINQRTHYTRVAEADVFSAGFGATPPGGHPSELMKSMGADAPKIPTLADSEDADAFMRQRVAEGSDYIKIIEDDGARPGEEAFLPAFSTARLPTVIAAAKRTGKLVIVHVQQLSAARAVVFQGANALAHAVCDAPMDAALLAEMKRRHVAQIGTLAIYSGIGAMGDAARLAKDRYVAPYLSPLQAMFLGMSLPHAAPAQFAMAMRNVGLAYRAGVPIMAGTDAPNPTTSFGASLHLELELLVRAGLTPNAALAAATSVPAHFFGAHDRGTIAPGRRADLVLIDGDPTRDIRLTRRIVAVLKNGYAIDRTIRMK